MLSAIARVRIIVGAEALGGVRRNPSQPAIPIALAAENATTIRVLMVSAPRAQQQPHHE